MPCETCGTVVGGIYIRHCGEHRDGGQCQRCGRTDQMLIQRWRLLLCEPCSVAVALPELRPLFERMPR